MAASIKDMVDFEDVVPTNEKAKMLNRELVGDMVNHPPHYEGFEFYLQGNIIKYLWRYKYKNGVEDLKKAQWYLTKLIGIKNANTS